MTSQQALELLNSVISQVSATREQHVTFIKAVEVLSKLVDKSALDKAKP